jgi:serine/threonine-protein kinase
MPQVSPSLEGQVLDRRYRLTRKIGEGGMGEVYAAEHVHIDKKVAIKLLRPEIVSNKEAVTRFYQEARSSSSIGHRNIIAIDDFGELPDGRIFMCMELLNGAALNDLIQQPMPLDRLLNILIQTGHGLAAAHAKGITHRDMKPENIFVTIGPNGEDVPKILDFGIAKVSGNDGQNHLTRTGTIFGTPFYMAPEQALGNPVDARTDIYAMGVIMYECFAGSLPFQGESFMGILTQHITTEAEPVAQRAAKAGRPLPPGVAEIITRCMQKNPAHRFGSMDELVNALIQVYRGVAGPGMSTYMEAFPVGSAQHMMQPTPPPMTGPMVAAHSATVAVTGPPPSGGHQHPYMTPPGMQVVPSGGVGAISGSPSGMYNPAGSSSVAVAKKSSMGLIIGILALLAVGGAVAAFVLLSQKDDKGGGGGSGSQVASNDPGGSGSQGGTTPGSDHGTTRGSDHGTTPGSDHTVAATIDAGADHAVAIDAAPVAPPPVEAESVLVMTKPYIATFEIWENGTKVIDGPDNVEITPGTPRTFVLKAKGFKDKSVTIDGVKKKLTVSLDRIPGSTHTTVTNVPQPPGHPDCSASVKDPKDKHCVAQYCDKHAGDPRCEAE